MTAPCGPQIGADPAEKCGQSHPDSGFTPSPFIDMMKEDRRQICQRFAPNDRFRDLFAAGFEGVGSQRLHSLAS